MNYYKMFRDVGVMDNDGNFINQGYLDIDKNCQKSLWALFGIIEKVYTFNDFTTDLYDFSIELKNLYTEVGINMGYQEFPFQRLILFSIPQNSGS